MFLPPPPPRCTETIIKKACDKLNIHCVPSRMAILTKPLNGRAACHYCAQCGRGCITASNFSSSQVMIPPAQATGRFTLITGAMAREIVVGKDGKAEAVVLHRQSHDDPKSGFMREPSWWRPAPASRRACCSIRNPLCFPTAWPILPERWDVISPTRLAVPPADIFRNWRRMPAHNHDGTGGMHLYMPWWAYDRKNDFLRGYHIEFGGGRDMPGVGDLAIRNSVRYA